MIEKILNNIKEIATDIFSGNLENDADANASRDDLLDMINTVASDIDNNCYKFIDIRSIALKPTPGQIYLDKIEFLFSKLYQILPEKKENVEDIINEKYFDWCEKYCKATGLPLNECNCDICKENVYEQHQNDLFDQGKLIYI